MSANQHDVLGETVVSFSRDGLFPYEDEVSAMHIENSALPPVLAALISAKSELESEIRSINRESAPEVDAWIANAKALQVDIARSRNLASEIVRQAEAGDSKQTVVLEAEKRVEFLSREASYNKQVGEVLQGIKNVQTTLDEAEKFAVERKALDALDRLSIAWDIIYQIPTYGRTRAIKLLDERAWKLRSSIYEDFVAIWRALVHADVDAGSVMIQSNTKVDSLNIDDTIIIMLAYNELDQRVKEFYELLERIIIRPRFDLKAGSLSSIIIENDTIRTSTGHADRTIKSALLDLEQIIIFLSKHLPSEFTQPLSMLMMPKLCSQIKDTWLDSAVPTSLDDMMAFRKAIALVQVFANNLGSLKWAGAQELDGWVANAPRIWLTKRRETSLDWTRNQLSLGIGKTRMVDRVETQAISRTEGKQLKGDGNDEWDAAWSDEEQDRTALERARRPSVQEALQDDPGSWTTEALHDNLKDEAPSNGVQDDDVADAWGWGDDDVIDEEGPTLEEAKTPIRERIPAVREVTLTEKYTVSSMPEPVLKTIKQILEDGATLTQDINDENPVTSAAAGLFSLPGLVLAMYRAVSPNYYAINPGGNMYLYNDAMWLAEQLQECAKAWANRNDLDPRAHGKVRLDNEIQTLENFAKRAYGSEMSTQRTVLNDLLGGTQNFLQQGQGPNDETAIEAIVSLIKSLSSEWKKILSKSAWAQATGSLLSTVAKKIILDVQDLSTLSADEAYRIANLISRIVQLDDLFLPEDKNQPRIPLTSQYAPNWLKLHYLSEVLQSNLNDVAYLWFDGELSLYFTVQEVVDLIELSFESSHKTREAITCIKNNPRPKGLSTSDT